MELRIISRTSSTCLLARGLDLAQTKDDDKLQGFLDHVKEMSNSVTFWKGVQVSGAWSPRDDMGIYYRNMGLRCAENGVSARFDLTDRLCNAMALSVSHNYLSRMVGATRESGG
jgi:hypothetical protein